MIKMNRKTFENKLLEELENCNLIQEYLERNDEENIYTDVSNAIESTSFDDSEAENYLLSDSILDKIVKEKFPNVVKLHIMMNEDDIDRLYENLSELMEDLNEEEIISKAINDIMTIPMIKLEINPKTIANCKTILGQ